MFRSTNTNIANNKTSTSPSKQSNGGDNTSSTIREIRSRTIGSTTANNARQLLSNRRQAMSMERLNGTSMHSNGNIGDRGKSSPTSGSSNSINGSATSSPSRNSTSGTSGGGLNRTASRVSRFRSAKAVFERLSKASSATNKPDKAQAPEKPRGTVASRYAAAAAARAAAAQQTNSNISPRSRLTANSLTRAHDLGRTSSNNDIHKFTGFSTSSSPKHDNTNQPKPQPRVITSTKRAPSYTATTTAATPSDSPTKHRSASQNSTTITATTTHKNAVPTTRPPPKDLIDKIVLKIACETHDTNCTIQDLSDCNTSGIPDTLDFDRCFQDVEMMTEEEARKLLSRKSASPSPGSVSSPSTELSKNELSQSQEQADRSNEANQFSNEPSIHHPSNQAPENHEATQKEANTPEFSSDPLNSIVTNAASSTKHKVRFSDEPVQVFDTHAIEDYDRSNNEINPAAAAAEYEIERSREREGLQDSDEDEIVDSRTLEESERFNRDASASNQESIRDSDNQIDTPHTPRSVLQSDYQGSAGK